MISKHGNTSNTLKNRCLEFGTQTSKHKHLLFHNTSDILHFKKKSCSYTSLQMITLTSNTMTQINGYIILICNRSVKLTRSWLAFKIVVILGYTFVMAWTITWPIEVTRSRVITVNWNTYFTGMNISDIIGVFTLSWAYKYQIPFISLKS